jgi:putative PIN family toxin of toxin-antitoxin system
MLKIVLDTNVLVSGIIASGYSASILAAVQRQEIKIVTSTHLLEEFSEVIARPHLAQKYPNSAKYAEIFLDFLRAFAILTPGFPLPNPVSTDPDDDFVLACALEQKVDCIVSGDPHLLSLKIFKKIPILTPKEFVERFSIPHKSKS